MLRLQTLRVTRTSRRRSQRDDHPLLAIILSTLLLFTCSLLAAPAVSKAQPASGSSGNDIYPLPEERPVLVVGIMVDQLRPDYISRFWDKLSDGGFKRLINEGFTEPGDVVGAEQKSTRLNSSHVAISYAVF